MMIEIPHEIMTEMTRFFESEAPTWNAFTKRKRKRKTVKQRREQRRQNARQARAKGQLQMMIRHIARNPELLLQPLFLEFLKREGRSDLIPRSGFVLPRGVVIDTPPMIYDPAILEEYKVEFLGVPGETIPVNIPYLRQLWVSLEPYRLIEFDNVPVHDFLKDAQIESIRRKIDADLHSSGNPRES